MIILTRLNGQQFTLNEDLIETVEQTPDTVIAMTTGNKYVVKEKPDEIIARVIEFRRKIHLVNGEEE